MTLKATLVLLEHLPKTISHKPPIRMIRGNSDWWSMGWKNAQRTYFCLVEISSCKVNVCVLCRPPSSNIQYLESLYNNLSSFYPILFDNFILVGDFNIDFLAQNHPYFPHLLSIVNSFMLHQVVTSPTHYSHSWSPSVIDLHFVPPSLP